MTTEPKKQRGGDRGGRRPRIGQKRLVTLTAEQWAHVVNLGGGNGAEGVRKLIDADMERAVRLLAGEENEGD